MSNKVVTEIVGFFIGIVCVIPVFPVVVSLLRYEGSFLLGMSILFIASLGGGIAYAAFVYVVKNQFGGWYGKH